MTIHQSCAMRRALAVVLLLLLTVMSLGACDGGEVESTETDAPITVIPEQSPVAGLDCMTAIRKADIDSEYALLCELEPLAAVAGLRATERMYPASLTKLMTFIVAYEAIEDRSVLIEITEEPRKLYPEGSRLYIDVGDLLTAEQMMYALLLASDTDAALELATYVAGSESAFVELMNQKAEAMGLSHTHFVNVTGLHDKEHYSTAAEMALIFSHALSIPLGREILTTEVYVTYFQYYRDGALDKYRMTIYNTTLRDRFANNKVSVNTPGGFCVLGGKTGYTEEADRCLATVAQGPDGKLYILITGHADTGEDSARDAVKLFDRYAGTGESR